MLVASELKGELARIHPVRACCRRAELAGLLYVDRDGSGISTLDHATARVAVHLAASLGIPANGPRPVASAPRQAPGARHHLQVVLDRGSVGDWDWRAAKPCDRRAFLRGVLLNASVSVGAGGTHIELVFRDAVRARWLVGWLAESGVHAGLARRRGRQVVYLKGGEEIAALLRLVGANRTLLDYEAGRVSRDVRNRLNRLLNAEEANLDRTVRAADRQLRAITHLATTGELEGLPTSLREVAKERRLQPDADLDTLASSLGLSRSAVNHRLRRLVALADASRGEEESESA
jgi:DNA-binding transcriptional regulator WhiA